MFAGDKMKYQQWDAAFTSCVDQAPLTPQFKMLRLESCLRGEAAETIKGLGYSKEAYDAARARLARKYGGSRRQIQSHLEELKKLKPLQEGSAKDLEAFADVLERAVICLKENGRQTDLEAGTLYTIILEKNTRATAVTILSLATRSPTTRIHGNSQRLDCSGSRISSPSG